MKSPIYRPIFLLLALCGVAAAEAPKKVPLSRYSRLWSDSPFTSKPPPGADAPVVNPLDDYALIGVSPISNTAYRVTMINKKSPDDRITVDSDNPKANFKVLEVIRKAGSPLGTIVRMSSGAMTGSIAFDESLLTLAAAPAPQNPPGGNPQPPQPQNPGMVPQPPGGQPQRQPRPRVVPPPAPAGQPQQQVQQQQQQRPNRR